MKSIRTRSARTSPWLVSTLVVVLLGSVVSIAQQPWDGPPFSADPAAVLQALQAVPVKGDPDVVSLIDEDDVVYTADGRSRRNNREVYWARTPEGASASSIVGVSWEPWHQKLPFLRARVIRRAGTTHELDPATLQDTPVRDGSGVMFSDRHFLRAPLPAMSAGAVVEFQIILEDTAPRFVGGGAWRRYFPERYPAQRSVVTIEYPSTLPLEFKAYSLPNLSLHKSESGGKVVLRFEHGPLDVIDDAEPLTPEEVYSPRRLELSTGASWNAVAAAYAKIIDEQLASADLKPVVKVITAGKGTPRDIAAALLEYVHREVRYTGIEFGESSLIPHTPKEVLNNKYGDCKDQAALLVGLLRSAGVPAYIGLLATAPGENVSRDNPGVGQFDHAVVYVPDNPAFWIDVSAEFWHVGDLPDGDQGRLALVISPTTSDLITTPQALPEANRVMEVREVFLAEFGPGKVIETTDFWGSPEAEFRMSLARESDPEKHKKQARDYSMQVYGSDSVTVNYAPDPRDLTAQLTTRLEIHNVKSASTDLYGAFAVIGHVQITDRLPEYFWPEGNEKGERKADARKTDLALPMPYVHEVRYRIQPPPGFRPAPMPSDKETHLGPCLLTQSFATDASGVVTAILRFDTVKWRLTPTEVTQLKKGVREFVQGDATIIRFEHVGQADLETGRFKEAFDQFKSLIKLHPSEALHHVQLAKALLASGMGEAAREEARAATRLDPKSALAQKTLGWILQHDLVGRRFGKGFDRDGAVAAYRAAMTLDPADAGVPIDLAILLEHNNKGVRYGSGSNLEEAIKLYRSVKTDLETYDVGDNLFFALLWALKFTELQEELKSVGSTPDRNALTLAAVAAVRGSSSAIQEAKLLGHDDQKGRAALARGAQLLLELRKYSQAADLMIASASAGRESAQIIARAEVLRHAQRHEEVEVKASDPRSVVLRYLRAVMEQDPVVVMSTYSRYTCKEDQRQANIVALGAGLRWMNRVVKAVDIPREVFIDLTVSLVEMNVEGDDQNGYIIRAQTMSDNTQVFFVIKEQGEYKIIANVGPEDPNGIDIAAGYLRELLRRENDQEARIWLDRLREQTALGGGDDPLSGPLLPRFWKKDTGNTESTAVQYASAALMASSDFSREAIPILLEGRNRATSNEQRTNFDLALAIAYSGAKQYVDMVPVTERLLTAYSRSDVALSLHISALRHLARYKEAQRFLQARLEQSPENPAFLRYLALTFSAQGDFQKAIQQYETIIATGKAIPSDFNNLAWNNLFAGNLSKTVLAAAERAVLLTDRKSGYAMHTLACLYAEMGRTAEARDLLIKDMEVEDMEEPDANVWYGFGRIAEQYGLPEVARAAYGRVTAPKEEFRLADSTYTLAQQRMKPMQISPVSR